MKDFDPPGRGADPLEAFAVYRPLALAIARRFARKFPYLGDDFESHALYALWLALPRLDPAGRPLRYLKLRLEGELKTFLQSKAARVLIYFRDLESDHAEDVIHRIMARGPAVGDEFEFADLIHRLTPRHRRIVDGVYRGGLTDVDMGRRLGVSNVHAGHLRRQALALLRSAMVG